MMKILMINPNSDESMTEKLNLCGRAFAAGKYQVDCKSAPGGPPFVETYWDMQQSAPGMAKLLLENMAEYDAFVIACGYDPNLDLMRELTCKPVVGTAEASMKMATMLGHRFTVLCTDDHSVPIKEDMVCRYGLERQLASVRVVPLPEEESPLADVEEAYARVCRRAVEEDGAEVIVLSCAGYAGLSLRLTELSGVPVLSGMECGLVLAAGMVQCGVSISKARQYSGSGFPAGDGKVL